MSNNFEWLLMIHKFRFDHWRECGGAVLLALLLLLLLRVVCRRATPNSPLVCVVESYINRMAHKMCGKCFSAKVEIRPPKPPNVTRSAAIDCIDEHRMRAGEPDAE